MPLVVGTVRVAVLHVQGTQAGLDLLELGRAGQIQDEGPDLRAEEVVGTRRAELGQPRHRRTGDEIEHDVGVRVVADLRSVGRGEAAQQWQEGRGTIVANGLGERFVALDEWPEWLGSAVVGDEALGGPDDVQRVGLAGRGRVAPGRDAVATEHDPDRFGPVAPDRRHVQPELEAGSPPRHPGDTIAEAVARQPFAVGCGGQRDARVRVQVVDVVRLDEPVHRGVDRWRRAAAPEEAMVERRDHLVLAIDARVDIDERTQTVQPDDGEPGLGQRAEVATGALDPQQLDLPAGHRVGGGALGGRVAARVVGGARNRRPDDATARRAGPRRNGCAARARRR